LKYIQSDVEKLGSEILGGIEEYVMNLGIGELKDRGEEDSG